MIIIECTWCDGDILLDGLDATSVDCPDCLVTVEIAPDTEPVAMAA